MSEQAVVAICKCGGWVMVAAVDFARSDTWKEVGELAQEGFEIRTMPSDDFRADIPPCEHRGACVTGSVQEEIPEPTP